MTNTEVEKQNLIVCKEVMNTIMRDEQKKGNMSSLLSLDLVRRTRDVVETSNGSKDDHGCAMRKITKQLIM